MAGAEEGSSKGTVGQCITEQKAVTGEERRRKAGEEPAVFPVAEKCEAADEAVPEEDEYEGFCSSLEEELAIARAALSAFPEAAALGSDELDAAAGRLVEQSKPESCASAGKTRLSHDDIWLILNLQPDRREDEAIGRAYLDSLERLLGDDASRGAFPEGWLEERKREHLESLPFCEKAADDFEAFQAKVRTDLIHKGFVEVDEAYWEKRAEMEALFKEEWKHIDLGRLYIANTERALDSPPRGS